MSDSSQPCCENAPLSMGFPRQEYWSGLPFPSPGDFPDPQIEPGSLALRADTLPSKPPEKSLPPEESLYDQCKEIEEKKRVGKTRYLFKKIRDTKGICKQHETKR